MTLTLAQAANAGAGNGFGMLIPMILIFGIFYFLMIRPQQRKEKERQKMIAELRAGKRVVFSGGILGTVTETKETTFIIEIANGVKIEVSRSAVSEIIEQK